MYLRTSLINICETLRDIEKLTLSPCFMWPPVGSLLLLTCGNYKVNYKVNLYTGPLSGSRYLHLYKLHVKQLPSKVLKCGTMRFNVTTPKEEDKETKICLFLIRGQK